MLHQFDQRQHRDSQIDGYPCTVTNIQFDSISRFFAPAAGIDENPVTGSAHCCLAPYWGALLGERVRLAGQAVTVLAGELI